MRSADPRVALRSYEAERLPATAAVVKMNRTNPPDAILREVYYRSGDKPFSTLDDLMTREEIDVLLSDYKRVTGNVG